LKAKKETRFWNYSSNSSHSFRFSFSFFFQKKKQKTFHLFGGFWLGEIELFLYIWRIAAGGGDVGGGAEITLFYNIQLLSLLGYRTYL